MRWYLPDRHPVFWNEIRRQFTGRRRYLALLVCAIVACPLTLAWFQQHFQSDLLDLSGNAFYASVYLFRWLTIIILAPLLSAGLISGEREHHALDFLLLLPSRSSRLVLQKYLAALLPLLTLSLLFFPLELYNCWSLAQVYPTLSLDWYWEPWYWLGLGELLFLCCIPCFVAIGLMFSSMLRNTRSALIATYAAVVLLPVLLFLLSSSQFLSKFIGHQHLQEWNLYSNVVLYLLITIACLNDSVRALDRLRHFSM